MAEPLLLVLAGEQDAAAAAFVARHRAAGARLLRPADLSTAGWSFRVGDAAASIAVAEGERCPAASLRGVLTRLSGIEPAQLPHVAEVDRDYVAAEMSAFLLAWLSALPCPVWNRPVAPSIAGPGWRWPQWAGLAAQLGVPVAVPRHEVRRGAAAAAVADAPMPGVRVDVIGSAILGPDRPVLAGHARRLADAAGVSLLGLAFDGDRDDARLTGVDPWPDLAEPAIGDAVMGQWR